MRNSIKVGSLFSGIGAFEQALKQLGIPHKIVFAGDIDEFCKQSYFANYDISEDRWHKDIKDFDASVYKDKIDLLVGGSPCQAFSIMGKRKGFEEARGTLFYEYARVIKEANPKVFIFENVTGLLNHDKGRTWEVINATFDELGYKRICWVLNAKDFNLPQNRRRIFVVGFRTDIADKLLTLNEPQKLNLEHEMDYYLEEDIPNKYYLPEKGFIRVTSPNESKHVALNGKIARCQVACQQYNWFGDMRFISDIPKRIEEDERIFKGVYKGVRGVTRCLTPRECLRLMGFEDSFQIVVNDTQMYRQTGNSIAVNVLKEIMQNIIKTEVFD